MKEVKEYHNPLYHYLIINRGVGHTRLIIDGVRNAQYPFLVVGSDLSHANSIIREMGGTEWAIPVSIQNENAFRGHRHPVVIDNYTYLKACDGYISTIRDYRESNQRLRELALKQKRNIDEIKKIPFWKRLFKSQYVRRINKIIK